MESRYFFSGDSILASAVQSNSQVEHRGTAADSSLAGGVTKIKKDTASQVILFAS
jgi:hypothetical protein